LKRIFLVALTLLVVSICLAGETEQGIYYKDGTFQKGSVEQRKPVLANSYLILNDSLKVTLETVRGFIDEKGYHLKITNPNGKHDCATQVIEGKISVYNNFAVVSTGFGTKRKTTYYYNSDESVGFEVNYKNLRYTLSENPQCKSILMLQTKPEKMSQLDLIKVIQEYNKEP